MEINLLDSVFHISRLDFTTWLDPRDLLLYSTTSSQHLPHHYSPTKTGFQGCRSCIYVQIICDHQHQLLFIRGVARQAKKILERTQAVALFTHKVGLVISLRSRTRMRESGFIKLTRMRKEGSEFTPWTRHGWKLRTLNKVVWSRCPMTDQIKVDGSCRIASYSTYLIEGSRWPSLHCSMVKLPKNWCHKAISTLQERLIS